MLRRQLLFMAAGFIAAFLIEHYMGAIASTCAGAAILIVFFFVQKQDSADNRKLIMRLILVSYFFGAFLYFHQDLQLANQQEQMMNLSDSTGVSAIPCTVREVEVRRNEAGDRYVQMTVKAEAGLMLVNYYSESFSAVPGDHIDVRGTVSLPQGRRNPGCFDYALYLKSRNIPVTVSANNIMFQDDTSNDSIEGKIFLVKESFVRRLQKATDKDTAAMMRAIMFGDKGGLDEDTLETFQRNGTAHILAVSGLHIGIIYGFILRLWKMIGNLTGGLICGRKGLGFFGFNAAFFGCYMVMADFSPSVVRAVIMIFIHMYAQLRNRRYDLSNAAIFVMLLVLAKNPFMLFNVGFQMSFLAVLTLVMVMPFIRRFHSGVLLSGLAVQIGLGPFIVYTFNYVSLIAVLINLPVIFLAGIIVPAGLINMALVGLPIFDTSAKAAQLPCQLLQWINEIAEVRGITTFQVHSPPLWLICFYYLALLVLATEEGRLAVIRAARVGASAKEKLRRRIAYVAKMSAVLLLISAAFAYAVGDHFEDCNLTFVDVGQGDCICVQSDGAYLVDGGGNVNYNLGKKTLRNYLLKNGMSHVDGAFVTHLHTDHYKGICELCREKMVRKLFVYEGNRLKEKEILEDTGLKPENIEYIRSGQIVQLGEGGLFNHHRELIEVLWPERETDAEYARMLEDEENENAMSLVLRMKFENHSVFGGEDETSLLVTGDMGEEGEQMLIAESGEKLQSTILKVAHHGSKYSSSDAFLDVVSPKIGVIQVGKNNYGHPSAEVLNKLKDRGINIYRNDTDGAIGFAIRNGEIRDVVTMIQGQTERKGSAE